MMRLIGVVNVVGVATALLASCGDNRAPIPTYTWQLPAGFPEPFVPADNPMSAAKVELGRFLFFDPRLSFNSTTACATCHLAERAFADDKIVARGATGVALARNSPSLQNVAYHSTYTWASPVLVSLEQQIRVPMFGDDPVEMGMHLDATGVKNRLRDDAMYAQLFADAFPEIPVADQVSEDRIVYALASFMRSMISGGSALDQYQYGGNEAALSDAGKRGMALFNSERLECYHCHAGLNQTNAFRAKETPSVVIAFENDGLYNIGNMGKYPANNPGLFAFTGDARDEGSFRVPSLRNVMVTPPYMHDGSIATIDEVLDMYQRGGRLITEGPFAGDGAMNRNKSIFVRGFQLSASERDDLKAFLAAMTDDSYRIDPRFANPFK